VTEGIGMCWACKRLDDSAAVVDGIPVSRCEAFPDGIPLEIFVNGFDHRREFPGDNGLRFVPISDSAEVEAMAMIAEAVGSEGGKQ